MKKAKIYIYIKNIMNNDKISNRIVSLLKYKIHESKLKNPAHRNELLFERLSFLLEKEIEVGANLEKKLQNINKDFSKRILDKLKSSNMPDKVSFDKIEIKPDDDKTLTTFYKDKDGNQKERKFKIGKLLNYIGFTNSDFKGYEIEELISHFKKGSIDDFTIVEGDAILWAYSCNNTDSGESTGSCMSNDFAQKYLKIYVDNPKQIKCIVLLNRNNGKICGRALLWTLDDGSLFMDKMYVTNNEYETLFNLYAEEKSFNTRYVSGTVTLDNGGEYEYYPYIDTFMYYNTEDGVLSTDEDEDTIKLQSTDGGYTDGGVYIDYGSYEGERVHEDDAFYLNYRTADGSSIEGYCHYDDTVYVDDELYLEEDTTVGLNGRVYFTGDEDVVEITNGDSSGYYANYDEVCILSKEHYSDYENIAEQSDCIELDGDLYSDISDNYILEEDSLVDYDNRVIHEDDSIKLFKSYYKDEVAHKDDEDIIKIVIDGNEEFILNGDIDEIKDNFNINENKKTKSDYLHKVYLKSVIKKIKIASI